MRRAAPAVAAVLLALVAAPPARPQSASPFVGNYRLTLTFASSCSTRVRSVSVFLAVAEQSGSRGAEVDGRPALPDEVRVAELALQRTGSGLHGPFATIGSRAEREPITTVEGHLAGFWLVLDGTVSAGSGRPTARGTAPGFIQAGRPEDDVPDTLGACTAADHSWTLEPV